jgi:hypothetical protein
MGLFARFPKLAAWVMMLVLVSVGTLCALQGLRALEPDAPPHLNHVQGIVVAVRAGSKFAVRVPGHAGHTENTLWFQVAQGARISLAHLQRHLRERVPTDVYYQNQRQGLPLAWIAD